eukprot:Nk52_evm41s2152 gene=Nk52_evmTU41s2152
METEEIKDSLTVKELKGLLKERRLSQTGNKAELIRRLSASNTTTSNTSKSSSSPSKSTREASARKKTSSTNISEEEIQKFKQICIETRKKITLWSSPFTTVSFFLRESMYQFQLLLLWALENSLVVGSLTACIAIFLGFYMTPGKHQVYMEVFDFWLYLSCWWVGLGILSSVGLGTGLHTFLLYLGPFIAKTTMAAWECGSVNFATAGEEAFVCPSSGDDEVSFWQILGKVRFEAFMWGAGTAIGELPPYFVARAARISGEEDEEIMEELNEIEEIQNAKNMSLFMKMKKGVHDLVNKVGFFGILLCASIPNPLFDLAGITCGHFLIPFTTFFGATLIGKAVIKTHIQMISVIMVFSKQYFEMIIALVEKTVPVLRGPIEDWLLKQRNTFHRMPGHAVVEEKQKSIISTLWDTILIVMLGYFVVSIVNSMAQTSAKRRDDDAIRLLEGKQRRRSSLE